MVFRRDGRPMQSRHQRGLYSDLSAAEIEHVARDCAAEFAMVEDEEQADKMRSDPRPATRSEDRGLLALQRSQQAATDETFIGLRDVLEMGRRYEADHPGAFEKNVAAGKADDVCAIVYTSGATRRRPEGSPAQLRSLMSDSQYYWKRTASATRTIWPAHCLPPGSPSSGWRSAVISSRGAPSTIAESSETQQEDIREIAPSVALYNSRLWESQAGQVQAKLRGASRFKRSASRLAHAGRPEDGRCQGCEA